MRIGFDFRMGGSGNSGIGRYGFELLKHLIKQNQNDTFVVLYNPKTNNPTDLDILRASPKVELVKAPYRHYSISEQLFLPFLLRRLNLHFCHFPNFNVPVFCPVPFVVTIHDLVHHELRSHKPVFPIYYWGYQYVIKQAVLNSRAILCPSESTKQAISQDYPSTQEKIFVIYESGTLERVDSYYATTVLKSFLLERPYFLFVGTLERKKMIPLLAEGFSRFIEKYKLNMDLVIAGKPDLHYPDEAQKALTVKHSDRIVFTGFVSDSQLSALYQKAYAFVSSSPYEGFGLPGVEAMRFGLPLVVANTAVFNEIYDNSAIYFEVGNSDDLADKLRLLAEDTQFYTQMQEKSLARGSQFDWQGSAEQTYKVYEQFFSSNKTPELFEE